MIPPIRMFEERLRTFRIPHDQTLLDVVEDFFLKDRLHEDPDEIHADCVSDEDYSHLERQVDDISEQLGAAETACVEAVRMLDTFPGPLTEEQAKSIETIIKKLEG